MGLSQVLGCPRDEGIFASFFDLGERVAWILRLVKIGAEGEGRALDVMEINRPDDLGDIADLGLTLDETTIVGGAPTRDRRRAGQGPRGSAADLLTLWRRLPGEGLSGPRGGDAVRPRHGTTSSLSLCEVFRKRTRDQLAIALSVDTGTGSASGASLRPHDL